MSLSFKLYRDEVNAGESLPWRTLGVEVWGGQPFSDDTFVKEARTSCLMLMDGLWLAVSGSVVKTGVDNRGSAWATLRSSAYSYVTHKNRKPENRMWNYVGLDYGRDQFYTGVKSTGKKPRHNEGGAEAGAFVAILTEALHERSRVASLADMPASARLLLERTCDFLIQLDALDLLPRLAADSPQAGLLWGARLGGEPADLRVMKVADAAYQRLAYPFEDDLNESDRPTQKVSVSFRDTPPELVGGTNFAPLFTNGVALAAFIYDGKGAAVRALGKGV